MTILAFATDSLALAVVIEQINEFTEYEFALASSLREVEHAFASYDIEGVCVHHLSIRAWWDLESRLRVPLTVPRIVAHSVPLPWSQEMVKELGFDGAELVDLTTPARDYMGQLHRALVEASTRGSRAPNGGVDAFCFASMEDLLDRDPIDIRIMRLIASGHSDREIAAILYLSTQTIRNRVSSILHRTGQRNRTALASTYLVTRQNGTLLAAPCSKEVRAKEANPLPAAS